MTWPWQDNGHLDPIIDDMLANPLDWVNRRYTFENDNLGIKIWLGSGFSFFGYYGQLEGAVWTWREKMRFRKALRQHAAATTRALTESRTTATVIDIDDGKRVMRKH